MTAQASIYGRLGGHPKAISTRTGNSMAAGSIAVDMSEDDAPVWFGVVAFGRLADELLRHGKGDLISVSGRLQLHRWMAPDGTEREQLQVVADSIISARTTRPKGGRKPAGAKRSEHIGELVP